MWDWYYRAYTILRINACSFEVLPIEEDGLIARVGFADFDSFIIKLWNIMNAKMSLKYIN